MDKYKNNVYVSYKNKMLRNTSQLRATNIAGGFKNIKI